MPDRESEPDTPTQLAVGKPNSAQLHPPTLADNPLAAPTIFYAPFELPAA